MNSLLLAASIWTLIAVTGEGDVHHADFTTKHQCDEAANIALYGETIEQGKAIDDQLAAEKSAEDAAWKKQHPCRVPTTKLELRQYHEIKTLPETLLNSGVIHGDVMGIGNEPTPYIDGKQLCYLEPLATTSGISTLFRPNLGESVIYLHGFPVVHQKTDVKHAECLHEDLP